MAGLIKRLLLLLTVNLYSHVIKAQELVLIYNIREEQMPKTFVGNIARDSLLYGNVTEEEFKQLRFQILDQGNKDASYFQINSTSSSLWTKASLDREILCTDTETVNCVLKFNIAVYKQFPDSGQIDLFKIIPVQVSVEDVNDNAPEFPEPEIAISISEGVRPGFVVITSGATDHDTGVNNSIQSYRIEPANEMFGLSQIPNIANGIDLGLLVRFQLDRETKDFYEVTLIASDKGFPVRTGTVRINITITDENDNPPLFTRANYTSTIPENKPIGSTVLLLSASDIDIGQNGKMAFAFSSRVSKKVTDKFGINETSGEVFIRSPVNYEDETDYQFIVVVSDHGQTVMSSTAIVKIFIEDLNDNAPQININLPPGGTDISEDAEEGRYVANVVVSDQDSGENGRVSCQVMGTKFRLEEIYTNMYKIVIKNKLDYETDKFHNVTVNCHDGGIPRQQNLTSFFIRVQDVNDNPPEFTKTIYEASIDEEQDIGEFVIEVMATDKDSGKNAKITYHLHSDANNLFSIDPTMGTIMTNEMFDRELTPVIRFHVNATDDGEPRLSSSSLVILTLRDVNDNPPRFSKQLFTFYALENQDRNPKIGVLTASDPDAGINGQFTFDFVPPVPIDFQLDSDTGIVRGVTRLDRELQPQYNFTVMVIDKGSPVLFSKARVTVNVIDDNDNIPKIVFPNNHNNTVYLPYTSPIGTQVIQVEAHDNDEGDNSKLLYYIDQIDPPNSRELFNMDVHTGSLVIAKRMHLYDADTYNLVLAVKDSGISQTRSYTNLNVIITVSNTTVLPPPTEDDTGMNMIIVVIIVIVTAVLSIAIVVTIIVIRKIDKNSQNNNNAPKNEEKKIITTKRHESMSTNSSHMSEDPLKRNKNKKEVSFSLSDENDSVNTSSLTNITTFSTFKNPPSVGFSVDSKNMEIPQASSSLLTSSNYSDMSRDSSMSDKKYELCKYYNSNHLRPQSPETIWLQQLKQEEANHIRDILRKGDDANSEMSAESATSDSGRGGSEEDVNSNRGHPLSDTEEPRLMYPGDLKAEFSQTNSSRHSNALHSNFRDIPENSVSDSFHKNISFSDDSVTANTTVDSSKLPLKGRSFTPTKSSLSSFSNISYGTTPYRTHTQPLYSVGGQSNLDTVNEGSFGLKYSLADIDDTISESVATRDGDGDSTTTSGSYTINPDELCHEIDNLFFKDVIV